MGKGIAEGEKKSLTNQHFLHILTIRNHNINKCYERKEYFPKQVSREEL